MSLTQINLPFSGVVVIVDVAVVVKEEVAVVVTAMVEVQGQVHVKNKVNATRPVVRFMLSS